MPIDDISKYDKFTTFRYSRPGNRNPEKAKEFGKRTMDGAMRTKKFTDNRGEWKSQARHGVFRCNICDSTKAPFYPDPDKTKGGYLCTPCTYEYQDVMSMWSMEDELDEHLA